MGFTRLLAAGLTAAVLANLLSSGSADLRRPLTDKEVDALAEQWDEDEEEDPDDYDVIMKKKMENRGGGGAGFDLDALKGLSPEEAQQHMGAASAKGQTKMLFVQFNPGIEQTEMEKKMGFWTGQLMNNALALKAYPIETEQMLVTIDDGAKSPELIKFLTSQQEIDRVELDQVKHFGVNSWSKKNSGKAEKKRAETEKKNKVRGDKYQARKAREEKLVEEGKDPFKENLKKGAKKKKKKTAKGKKKKGGAKKKKKKPKDEL